MPAAHGFVAVPGGELCYERTGSGTPIVFVHAGIADLTMWEPQVEAFAPSYDVVRFDSRGFGRSRSEAGAFSPVEDLREVLDVLEIDSAVLVGCSRGGQHALDFAVDSPDRLRALVWVCGGISGRPETSSSADEAALFDRIEELWQAKEIEELVDLETHVWVDGPLQPVGRAPAEVRDRIWRLIHDLETREEIDLQPESPKQPAAENLGRVTCPLLVVIGALDTTGTRAAADLLSQSVPHAERVDFPDSAHLPSLEHPERFNRALSEFLLRHDL